MSHTSSPEILFDPSKNKIKDENESVEEVPQKIMQILDSEGIFESPIDINISKVIPVNVAPLLKWVNYELPPKKMKITNTGHTVILSGKWGQERPYITNGILSGKYVFSQMHLHWGVNDMEGSEHTIDGCQYPGEMHVVTFKSCYLTQESALKETDGVVIIVYLFRLQDPPNPGFQMIADALPGIAKAHTSVKIVPAQLSFLMRQFESDYYMYRGSVSTTYCVHHITWLLTRIPLGVSPDQIDSLRYLLDNNDELIKRNFRDVQPIEGRHVFHILPSSSKYSTLLPIPEIDMGEKIITQIYRIQLFCDNDLEYLYEKFYSDIYIKWSSKLKNHKNRKSSKYAQLYDIQLTNGMLSVIENLKKYINEIFYVVLFVFYLVLIKLSVTFVINEKL